MATAPERVLGRYALFGEIASGGMGSVHYGRLLGAAGFSRTVAIKRLHPPFAREPELVQQFVGEARLCARVRHPNVLPTLDVVALDDEVFLVMELVIGEALSGLVRAANARREPVPLPIAAAIMVGALQGLHAAHEAVDEAGAPLGLVHRDVSPQNVLVGTDGVARVLDFGIAKASSAGAEQTRAGVLKGKVGYLAPEQVRGEAVDRRVDVYAASVVLWEMLTGARLFATGSDQERLEAILRGEVAPPSALRAELPPALDEVVLRGLARERDARYPTALEMALALEATADPASTRQVGAWVELLAAEPLRARRDAVAVIERGDAAAVIERGDAAAVIERGDAAAVKARGDAETVDERSEPFLLGRASGAEVTRPNAPEAMARSAEAPPARGRIVWLSLTLAALLSVALVVGLVRRSGSRAGEVGGAASGSIASASIASASIASETVASASRPECADPALRGVTQLAAGPASHHTCALTAAGEAWCWGDDHEGQLGLGTTEPRVGAERVPKLERVTGLAVGNAHTCALHADGRVSCWGKGLALRPTHVLDVAGADTIAAGGRFACARVKGEIECWGDDDAGQLGASAGAAAIVARISGIAGATRFSAGTAHACAIVDARVRCWGSDGFGQLGQGTTDARPHPVPVEVAIGAPVVEVAAGDKTSFAITRDGAALGWGYAVKRPVRVKLEDVVSIAAGGRLTCARRLDAAVFCWGFNDLGELGRAGDDEMVPVPIDAASGARAVVAGDEHACALAPSGEVLCWGGNRHGELGQPPDAQPHPKPTRVLRGECR